MLNRLVPSVLFLLIALAGAAGCRCHSCNRCPPPCPTNCNAPVVVPSQQFYQAPAAAPCPNCVRGPVAAAPAPTQRFYQAPVVAAPQPPVVANNQPTNPGTWQPVRPGDVRPLPPPDASTRAKLDIPEPMDRASPPTGSIPGVNETPSNGAKKADLAIEIPQFDIVYEKVAAGLQPFPDGFTMLRENGYRTVLRIHRPEDDGSALQTDIESKGLKYQSLAVSPKALNREVVDQFSKIIGDPNAQPIFVFDRRGQLAGALWYLHFRLNDGLPESEARRKAVRLGLDESSEGENAELWLAINQILRGA